MKYLAFVMRLAIIAIWVFMIITSPGPLTPPFTSWVAFVLIWLYLALTAIFWPKTMLCPFIKCENCSSIKK